MSLGTWKAEFYPTPVDNPDCHPVMHSLRKWRGLTNDHLEKHGLLEIHYVSYKYAQTCALCFSRGYDHSVGVITSDMCRECPIVLSGQKSCLHDCSAWQEQWCGDVSPMIEALEKTWDWVCKQTYIKYQDSKSTLFQKAYGEGGKEAIEQFAKDLYFATVEEMIHAAARGKELMRPDVKAMQ